MDGEETEEIEPKPVLSQFRVLCPGGQAKVKPRTVPPPQGPGGRFRGTDGQCPSSSDAERWYACTTYPPSTPGRQQSSS